MHKQDNPISRRTFVASAGMLTAGFFLPARGLFEDPSPVTIIIGEAAKSPVTVQKLRNNLNVLDGSGGNIVVFTGPEGKLMVDAGIDVSKEKIKKVLAGLGKEPLKYLINTHWHFDHASGNAWVHGEGATIVAHANTKKNMARQIRVDDWRYTFPPSPAGALPTVTFAKDRTITLNGETIRMHYYGPAHTNSDIGVHFQHADVLHVGDTWWNGHYPFMDFNTGGTIEGMLRVTDENLKLVTDKTIIVPGHGPVGNKAQLIEYRDMLGEVKTRIQAMKKRGQSLREVVAGKPTKVYDDKWGKFVINGDFFTNLVYRSV
jgi:glyoxylase-like metal-dependent hydrolase (beta-lactamase superfamily II)